MNVLEKAEKALEHLKHLEGSSKSHELQASAGTLGRCLGALGSRQTYTRHYANLLHSAIPTLLALASHDCAEIRLVGDEALNRALVGGFAFHAYKTNITLQNQIDHTRNARWIRAALARICLGDCWLRPGVGKIRTQAQILFPKLSQIVRTTTEIQLIVEALENNLPRILNALAEYTTDEEISELSKALLSHIESSEAAVRRGVACCVARLCSHRDVLVNTVIEKGFDKLWPVPQDSNITLGWFAVIKAVVQTCDIASFAGSNLLTVQDYLELYQLCIHYIEVATAHNIQNAVMECITTLLSQATGQYKKALLEKHPNIPVLATKQRRHTRNISSASGVTVAWALQHTLEEAAELSFSGALQLGGSARQSASASVDDLTALESPGSPASEMEVEMQDTEQLAQELNEKLQEMESSSCKEDETEAGEVESGFKVNIGLSSDDDIPLKYGARLLASKFILTGNKGGLITDRSVRVSVKASALSCLSEILQLYPQAITLYLDKEADIRSHNVSGSSELTDQSYQDNINDFILERNVCYQESLTDSLSQDLLNKSQESHTSQQVSKKDSKSLEKSIDEQKSTKDVPSAILDSKVYPKDFVASGISGDTNMTTSNFTTNSGMTGSNDPMSTGYPMTSSGDILSSSIDLDMKFDHFGESAHLDNLDALKDLNRAKRPLKRTDEVHSKDAPDGIEKSSYMSKSEEVHEKGFDSKEFECQHMSDLFSLLEGHNDPQIRGLIRVCIGNYLSAALDLSHGDYYRWRNYSALPKDVSENISTDKLVEVVLKGLTDEIHSCVNHTLTALTTVCLALSTSPHCALLPNILSSLVTVERNTYWLCKVNLCRLYEKLPYQRLFILCPGYNARSKMITDTLLRLLADADDKVRSAAANAIAVITPRMYQPRRQTPTSALTQLAHSQTASFAFEPRGLALDIVRDMHFYHDLPDQLKDTRRVENSASVTIVVGDLMNRLMESSCKYYTQGLLESLHAISKAWPPWNHPEAFINQGILDYCLESLDCLNVTVTARTLLIDLCTLIYPVEIHNLLRHRPTNRDIFEHDATDSNRWQHLLDPRLAKLSEKFQLVVLRTLNVIVHLVEEVSPSVQMNKGALPGSPVRRSTQDTQHRKSTDGPEERNPLRKKPQMVIGNTRAVFVGNFYTEPFYLKLYDNLRAAYSNHKINLDPKSSIFHSFLSSVLDALTIQLELSTEKEFGYVTEEILYYLKTIMPLCADKSVYCITQLLKSLFGTNMLNQYSDFMSIATRHDEVKDKLSFFDDVLLINKLKVLEEPEMDRRGSVTSSSSQKFTLEAKNPKMVVERDFLINLESFSRNKVDRKWSTNKKELERYIRLFEPVVIQALKSYTMQNDIPLQCKVLCLLNQLLTLRVNYCMLDTDQIFIGFLYKQLDLVEQHEIPNCCDLVSNIMLFLVNLSSSKHHTKQIIELPKLIQLCDGLLASGAQAECLSALARVSALAFSRQGSQTLGRAQQQQTAAAREVLFAMLCKTMYNRQALDLVSCVLALSQDNPENYCRWSQLASDTLLSVLSTRSLELDSKPAVEALERLIDAVYRDVILEQCRVEAVLKILFQAPPDQATSPYKLKLRFLTTVMVLLRKILVQVPESEVLLTINYLKSTYISPQSIFFNVKTDIDPLNVLNVNENCANLSPDVILVRFLFKTVTYAILEVENCHEMDCANLDLEDTGDKGQSHRLLYSVCVNMIVQVKHMLHLTNNCLFPVTSSTAHTVLHNEQSGLNTGLYSPDENLPLELLTLVCLRAAHRVPALAMHWSHLLIRLKFLEQKYWQKIVGFVRNLPLKERDGSARPHLDLLQIGCFMALCQHFVENGLSEAVHLTWLLVNRIHVLTRYYKETCVKELVEKVHQSGSASGLLLQAVAARSQPYLQDDYALHTYHILSECHESQSGPLLFFVCRVIGKLEPSIAMRFAKLAIERCKLLKELPEDQILEQLTKDDVQVALEMLQRDRVHIRYPQLLAEVNTLCVSVLQLSPLDLSTDRPVNPHNVATTEVDSAWRSALIRNRCCQTASSSVRVEKQKELAQLLSNLPQEDLTEVLSCQEFDRRLLNPCFKVACDKYLRDFLDAISPYEAREIEKDNVKRQREAMKLKEEISTVDSNKLNVVNTTLQVFKKSDNKESKSQFFIPMTDNNDMTEKFGNLEITDEEAEIIPPQVPELYLTAVSLLDKSLTDVIRLFPKQNRPLSQSENFNLNIEQTIDRYTKRCHQVFQDKMFYQEFVTIQTMLTGFLSSLHRIISFLDEIDCDIQEKCQEAILPPYLAKNIAVFSVISLQYLTFLIKNKKIVESPVQNDVSFRVTSAVTERVVIDNVLSLTLENVSNALSYKEIWTGLNLDKNVNRTQSTISCLYAIVKYFVKDTRPLTLKHYIEPQEGPPNDMTLTCDKLISLVEYWEVNFYSKRLKAVNDVMGQRCRKSIEGLLVALSRLDIVSNIALIPPTAWPSARIEHKKDGAQQTDLPLQALQDCDVLEAFLFRVNLIGWSSKKQFEEIWVALLAALQGNGTHWAVRGITQLLLGSGCRVRRGTGTGDGTVRLAHLPRTSVEAGGHMQRLRNILVGTSTYSAVFDNVNFERIPLLEDSDDDGYHYAQFNIDYLKLASGWISYYEQSLYWTVLFTLVEIGHPELMSTAVEFVIQNPRHYCADLVVKGIISMIRLQVLPKELKKTIIEKLLDNMKSYSERHAIQILMVHLFSADNKLLSPKLTSDVSNMDPDVLMNSMERITLLYKVLRESTKKSTKEITMATLKYFLRETLPPAATLSRVVIEFLESCKASEKMCWDVLGERERWVNCSVLLGEIVFEVFETAVSQDQLPVLSGWIFEALCHLLSGHITPHLIPYCLILLMVSASPEPHIRSITPLCHQILRIGFHNCRKNCDFGGEFKEFLRIGGREMAFADRKLLCVVAVKSKFSESQLGKLKELCRGNEGLGDLYACLTTT